MPPFTLAAPCAKIEMKTLQRALCFLLAIAVVYSCSMASALACTDTAKTSPNQELPDECFQAICKGMDKLGLGVANPVNDKLWFADAVSRLSAFIAKNDPAFKGAFTKIRLAAYAKDKKELLDNLKNIHYHCADNSAIKSSLEAYIARAQKDSYWHLYAQDIIESIDNAIATAATAPNSIETIYGMCVALDAVPANIGEIETIHLYFDYYKKLVAYYQTVTGEKAGITMTKAKIAEQFKQLLLSKLNNTAPASAPAALPTIPQAPPQAQPAASTAPVPAPIPPDPVSVFETCINNLSARVTEADFGNLLKAQKAYDSMDSRQRASISKQCLGEFEQATGSAARINHRSNGTSIKGLAWYYGIEVEKVHSGRGYDKLTKDAGSRHILGIYCMDVFKYELNRNGDAIKTDSFVPRNIIDDVGVVANIPGAEGYKDLLVTYYTADELNKPATLTSPAGAGNVEFGYSPNSNLYMISGIKITNNPSTADTTNLGLHAATALSSLSLALAFGSMALKKKREGLKHI
ncbi:MAG: hypothetical protein FWG10_02135 [Eubacteriaceae bacterium]|nr:hypothetical protein [Eubacteriaceae bacterium]